MPSLFPGSNNDYIVAPFWADNDITHEGQISYESHQGTDLLTHVSFFIRQLLQTDFSGTWMLVAEWEDVPQTSGSLIIVRLQIYMCEGEPNSL